MNFSLMQTTKGVNPHPHIATCVNMWSITFLFLFLFFLWHLLNVGACIRHIAWEGHGVDHTSIGDGRINTNCPHISFVLFHNVTCSTNSIALHIHVYTTKLYTIMCTLVATCVILRSLECTNVVYHTRRLGVQNNMYYGSQLLQRILHVCFVVVVIGVHHTELTCMRYFLFKTSICHVASPLSLLCITLCHFVMVASLLAYELCQAIQYTLPLVTLLVWHLLHSISKVFEN